MKLVPKQPDNTMKTSLITGAICLLAAFVLTGCDTTQPQPRWDAYNNQANQRSQTDLGSTNANPDNTNPQTNAVVGGTTSNPVTLLQINDYLNENKQTLIPNLQAEYSTNKEALFAAVGGTGNILDFNVQDIFIYKCNVVVTMLFLWSNPDGSGGSGQVALSLDPNKDFEPSGCSMTSQMLISAQELASLTNQANTNPEPQSHPEQMEEPSAAYPPSQPTNNSWISDGAKSAVVATGIAVVGHWLMDEIDAHYSGNAGQ
jgi:hypothetical protein